MTTDDKRAVYNAAYALCGDFGDKTGRCTQAHDTEGAYHAADSAALLIAHIRETQGSIPAANLLQNYAAGYRHGYDAAAAEYDRELAAHPEDTYAADAFEHYAQAVHGWEPGDTLPTMTRIAGTIGGDGLFRANLNT